MVGRARLAPPLVERDSWPWHHVKWTALSASILSAGDRRMEGENYLESGYGLRLAMEARKSGWVPLRNAAHTWQPGRLKGILVSPDFGVPFLAATQVFDCRPVPRKWLSVDRIDDPEELYVSSGTVLVTRSGTVGRATLAHTPHDGILISDDLLRVEPRREDWRGWIYAYLRAPQGRSMMKAAQYGQ